jgi:hypothetical protein
MFVTDAAVTGGTGFDIGRLNGIKARSRRTFRARRSCCSWRARRARCSGGTVAALASREEYTDEKENRQTSPKLHLASHNYPPQRMIAGGAKAMPQCIPAGYLLIGIGLANCMNLPAKLSLPFRFLFTD